MLQEYLNQNGIGITVIFTWLVVIPWYVAVIETVPVVIAVNNPPSGWVNAAIVASELCHVTKELTSAVEPSEQVPVATKFWVKPSFKLGGLVGEIATEVKVAVTLPVVVVLVALEVDVIVFVAVVVEESDDGGCVVVDDAAVDPHADKTIVEATIRPITAQQPDKRISLIFIVI